MGMGMARNAAIVTPMFMATYENNVQLAKDLGYVGTSATSAGILFSMIEGYSELIFPDIDFFSSAAKKEAFKMFLDNFSKGGARMAVTRFMKTTGKEIGEEYVVELGKLLATASTTFLPGSTNKIYQLDPAQLLETTIFTFTSAGAGAAVQAKLTTSKRFNDSMMFRMAQDLETSVPMIQQYNQFGKIDNKKSEQLIKSLKVISAVQGQLPNDISTPKRVVISSLYAQISALEEKTQDPNITEEIRDSYKNSIKKIKDYITMVMLADDAEFTKSYNAEVEAQGKQVAEEVKKEHPDLGVGYSYLGGEKMEISQEDQTRTEILNDIFGDSFVQRKADALEQRMKNAEEIPVEEINSVIDGLYAQLESIMNNYFDNPVGKQYAQTILDKIDKLNNYEFATGTKTDVITERKAIQTARASVEKEVGVIQSASGVSTKAGKPNKNAKVTFENGESGFFTIRISDQGVVSFEPMSGAPVEMGPASEVNKSIQLVDMKMASNGMPSSITFSMQGVGSERGRKTVTVSIANGYNQNELLDLAINLRAKEVGTVDPTAFDEAFEEVTREVETKTYPNMPAEPQAAKEGVTQIQPQDAVQVETAGQVPVQPEATVGEQVAQGEPQAEPQAPAQEGRPQEVEGAPAQAPAVEKRQPRPSAQTLREAAARERLNKATQNIVKSFEGSGITVQIIEDEAEFDALAGIKGANGIFDGENGIIAINPKRMNLATKFLRVLFHESSHPVLNILYNTDRALYDKVLNGMKDSGKKGLPIWQDLLNFGKRYVDAGYSPEQVDNEILTEAIGRIINGEIKLNDIPVGWRQAFIDMLNKIAKLLKLNPIGPVTNAGKFRDFAASLKDVFEQGRSIAEIVGSENITKYQSPFNGGTELTDNDLQYRIVSDFTNLTTGITFEYLQNSKEFQMLVDEGYITNNLNLEDFQDAFVVLHSPDAAFSGKIKKNGKVLVDGSGGIYYPIKFHKDGYIWASTKSGAASLANLLNESARLNNGRVLLALTAAPKDKLLSSTTMANGVIDIFTSKIMDEKVNLRELDVVNALKNAAKAVAYDANGNAFGLRLNLTGLKNLDEIVTKIKERLSPDKSSFKDRKLFSLTFLEQIATKIKGKEAEQILGRFLSEEMGFEEYKQQGKIENRFNISKTNLTEAISNMLQEPLLRTVKENAIYAVIEVDASEGYKKGKPVVKVIESDKHDSYPNTIVPVNDKAKIRLHILQDRKSWMDNIVDPQTDEIIKKDQYKKLYPPIAGVSKFPVKIKTQPSLMEQRGEVKQPIEFSKELEGKYDVTVDLLGSLDKGNLLLSRIVVDKNKRGTGVGTEVMNDIITYADENNKTIVLSPSTDFNGSSVKRLVDFYKRFGFVENKGKNIDYSIRQSMYRKPQPSLMEQRVTIEPIDFENESENIDVYEASTAAEKLAKDNGVNILRGKDLKNVALDENGKVIGGLWTEIDGNEFSFDIVIDKAVQRKGVGEKLVNEAFSEFNAQDYDGTLKYKIDVTNPVMEKLLSKYGFEVVDRFKGHTIMVHPTNNPTMKNKPQPSLMAPKGLQFSLADTRPVMADVVNGFYSPIENRLMETKVDRQSANKWIGFMGKKDEAIYTGVLGWLESKNPQEQVSKKDIMDFMKNNRIEVREVDVKPSYMARTRYENERQRLTLPGEETDYKEILVVFTPKGEERLDQLVIKESKKGLTSEEQKEFDAIQKRLNAGEFKSSHWSQPNILVHLRMNTRTDANGNKVLFLEEIQSDWGQLGKKEGFRGTQAQEEITIKDIPNIQIEVYDFMASVSVPYPNEPNISRILGSVSDKSMTTDNFRGEKKYSAKQHIEAGPNGVAIIKELGLFKTMDEAVNAILNSKIFKDAPTKIHKQPPSAPFVTDTNAWTKLGLKIALKEAVRQKADALAWTTGEQQNERFDLSKQVDEVTYTKRNDGTYNVNAIKNDTSVISKILRENELEGLLGKDVAEKIINNEGETKGDFGITYKSLSGVDLKVGGKGMKAFYGDTKNPGIVGNVAVSLVGELTGTKPSPSMVEINSVEQPAIEVTPEVKASVKRGMPQFSLADNQMIVEKPGMDTLKAANISASEVANWRKQNKVSQREGRVTEVQQSAQDLADGKKTIYEHIETVKKAQPTRKTTSLKPMPSVKDVVSALADNQVKTGVIGLNVAIPKGTKVGSRLDIPSFNNYGINVVSVHDGTASGTSIGYGRAVSLSDVTFKTSPSQALNVATGASKGTFSRMMGTWNNESEESVYKRAKEALNDPNYIQIGTNPFRHSWFYDKNTGMPVMSASEILQVGNVVLAKDARVLDLTNAKDKAEFEDKFKVKLKSGKMSQFSLAAPNTVEGVAKALDEFGKNNKGSLEKLFVENRKYGKPLTISIQDGEDTIEIVFTNTEPKSNEPYAVQLSDGWPSVRRIDGTYSDGDLIYESWDDYLKQNEEAGNIDDGFKELEQNREIEVRSRSNFDKLDDFDSYSEIGFWNKATQILGDYLGYASPMQAVEESSIDSEILSRLTAKAVDLRKNGKVSDTYEFYKNVLELSDKDAKKRSEQNSLSNVIALEYYNAKQNGSNPKLVKAVEDVIGKSKPQFSLTADPAQVEDVSKKAKRAFPKGQFSMLESTVFMENPSDVAKTQYPLYQALMQLASDAFDNGARDIEAFNKYAADIQWPDELSRNYHTQTVWDDIIRIKQGKKPLINSQADYEKMLRNKAKSNASNLKEIAMKRTRKVKEVAKKWFFDSRAAWFNALARQSDSLFDLVAAYTDTIGGMTAKGLYQADMFMSTTYDGLSQIENIPFYGQMYSERRMFDEMLTLIGYMETNRKMEDKFDELIQLETAYLNETDPNKKAVLKDKRDYVKDYLERNKVLIGNGKTIPYSLKEFTRSNLNMASAERKLTELSLAYPDIFDKLYKRADAYFAAWNTLLGMRLDAGMLSQESYDEMTKYKYVPTRFLGYLLMEVSDETDAKLPEATSDQIERLRGGSEEQLVMAYDESLRFASLSVTRSIQKNKAVETLSRAIDANPNQVTFFKPEVSKRDRFGDAVEWVYDKKNFGLIKYYVDGKIEAIATEQAVADAFNGRQEQFQMPEGLGYIFMSTPFRMVTTNLNPGFGLAQIVIDLNQALLTNDAYMSITTGALPLLLKDIKLLGGLYLGRASKMMGLNFNLDKEWNELFTEAREYGALISFTQAETFESALEKASKAKTRLSNVGNAFSKGREKIEKLNTSMEYVTRLAIFGKMKKDLINEYKKNNNGQKPTGQAYDDILTKAASASMNMLNYNRGGSVIKPLNRVMAYLNVGFQVPYSIYQYAKKSPYLFTLKLSELSVYGVLVGITLYQMLDDDDKDKYLEYYNRLSAFEKSNYWHYPNPFYNPDDPDTWLLRYKKPTILLPIVNTVEVYSMYYVTNGKTQKPEEYLNVNPLKQDQYTATLGRDMYEAQPFKGGIISSMPTVNAAAIGFGNMDLYRMENVVPDADIKANPREGLEDPRVGQFFKYVSQIGVESPYLVDGSLSPKRMDASVKALIGDYSRNPVTAYPLYALGAMMNGLSGYRDAGKYVPAEPEKDIIDKLIEGSGITQRFTTRIPDLKPVTKKKMEFQKMEKNAIYDTIGFTIEQAVQEGMKPSKEDIRMYFKDMNLNQEGMFAVEDYEKILNNAFKYAQKVDKIKEVENKYTWVKRFVLTPSNVDKLIIWESETSDYSYEQKFEALKWLVKNDLFIPKKEMPKNKTTLDEKLVEDLKKLRYL